MPKQAREKQQMLLKATKKNFLFIVLCALFASVVGYAQQGWTAVFDQRIGDKYVYTDQPLLAGDVITIRIDRLSVADVILLNVCEETCRTVTHVASFSGVRYGTGQEFEVIAPADGAYLIYLDNLMAEPGNRTDPIVSSSQMEAGTEIRFKSGANIVVGPIERRTEKPAYSDAESIEIIDRFISETYQKRLVANHATVLLMVFESHAKKRVAADISGDAKLFDAFEKAATKMLVANAERIVEQSHTILGKDEQFVRDAREIALTRHSVSDTRKLLENDPIREESWFTAATIKPFDELRARSNAVLKEALQQAETELNTVIDELAASLPEDRKQRMKYLRGLVQ
jgi:hypothetical protein